MATILAAKLNLVRQEGDTADLVIEVPEAIDMTDATVKFGIYDDLGEVIVEKSSEEDEIELDGQIIMVPVLSEDTEGFAGTHNYELEITVQGAIITILKGKIDVEKEYLK